MSRLHRTGELTCATALLASTGVFVMPPADLVRNLNAKQNI